VRIVFDLPGGTSSPEEEDDLRRRVQSMERPSTGRVKLRPVLQPCVIRRFVLAGTAAAVLLNSGCITTGAGQWFHNGLKVGPNYGKPPAPVAAEWIQANDPAVQNHHLQDWWQVFADPTLDALIGVAYEQNPTLRIAGTRVLEARAGQAIAVGNIFPQSQQFTGSYARVNLNPNVPLLGTIAQIAPPGQRSLAFNNWLDGFNLSWELDLWGRIRRNIESNNASLDASVEDYDAALVTLLADVATNYVQYRVAQQRIKIALDNVRIQEGILALAEQKFKVGTTNRLDVEQAKTVLEQTRSTIPQLHIALGQANDTLCTLIGMPPRDLEPDLGPGPALGDKPMPNTPAWVGTGIPADLLRRRPDVRSAERRIAAQSAQIGVAEAALYPTIAINGFLGWDAANFSQFFETKSFLGFVFPSFSWNILNYGRIKNNVRLQMAKTQELIATYQNTVLAAGREVQTPLRGFLKSREQSENLERSVTAAKAATELGVQQYRTGTIDFNRVFNLETTQVQQQDQLAVAAGNIALNLVNVYRALGGGWELRYQKEQSQGGPESEHGDARPVPAAAPAAPAPDPLPTQLPPPRPFP
jgi:NodT family efflux transporter outer membrane factor (OMF) lipoprotein